MCLSVSSPCWLELRLANEARAHSTTEHRGVSCCSKRPDIRRAMRCEIGELMAQALRFFRPCPLTSVAQAIVAGFVHEGGDGASPRGCR